MAETFGAMLKRLREVAGFASQSALARAVPVSPSNISRYEADRQDPDPTVVERLDALLGAEGDLVRAAAARPAAALPTPSGIDLVYATASDLGAVIAEQTRQFQQLDDFVGGRELYPVVRRALAAASRAATSNARALPNLAELGQVGGWVASDAGKQDAAAGHYLTAAQAADQAERPDLAASALSSLAYQLANSDSMTDRAEAVLLASSVADRATGVGQALLLERLAWAHARIGDASSAARVLDAVDEIYATADEPAPQWAYWLNEDEITVMRGRCMVELDRPAAAIDLLTTAIDRYDPSLVRERGLYTTYLAEALAKSGELDEARRLLAATPGADSARVEARLRALCA
ncbi:helix-turn-helix transcriptional regulator [Amycolatopsis albispora]|uniref:helix-turn-helix transcriptional regulator n=1 Tax=Amycolatopsis albispora TaxID=1804986 RepID=UPI001F379696|nr:helix-turn-helix transcriptional regulator [Amycolatopsis albispora]